MSEGFEGPNHVPFTQLRAAVPDFDDLVAKLPGEKADAFVAANMQNPTEYRAKLAEKKQWYEGLKAKDRVG